MDLQRKQFTQQTMFPGLAPEVTTGTEPIALGPAERMRKNDRGQIEYEMVKELPNGGRSTSWQTPYTRGLLQKRESESISHAVRDAEMDTSHLRYGTGQLPMFMTPREIHGRYQPLDGDRGEFELYDPDSAEVRDWEAWNEASNPGTEPPDPYRYREGTESDDMLWERKLEEASLSPHEYANIHDAPSSLKHTTEGFMEDLMERASYPRPENSSDPSSSFYDRESSYLDRRVTEFREARGRSLYDRIAEEGVRSPVHLSSAIGQEGLPQIVGGHHRLAAATDIDQDKLIPVLHHRGLREAQSPNPAYKYS